MMIKKSQVEELYNKPYISIPFSVPKTDIDKAVGLFFNFLNLPDNIKTHIDCKISSMHRRGELGFVHRDPEDNIYNDSKDLFHYHPVIFEKYNDFINNHKPVKDFLEAAKPIWNEVHKAIHQILSHFETEYNGTLKKVFDSPEPHIVLRFLKYNFNNSSRYLAKPHFDSGSFTFAISESCPGLRIGTNPDDLEVVEHKEGNAIFMISSNYKKIIDTDKLKPGWHDVIQTDESKIGQSFARWAVVAFIDGHSVESLSRGETHKFYNPSGHPNA